MTRKLGAGCVLFILLGAAGLARGQAQGEAKRARSNLPNSAILN